MIIVLSSLTPINNDINSIDLCDVEKMVTNPENLDETLVKENEQFGFIIKKNPMSGMLKRVLANGELSGYYYNNPEIKKGYYILYFKDYDGSSYSYNNDESYLNPSQYVSSRAVLAIINEVLPLTQHDTNVDKDNTNINTFHIMNVLVNHFGSIRKLIRLFPESETKINFVSVKNNDGSDLEGFYKLTITTKRSFNYLINLVFVLMTIITSLKYNNYNVSDSLAEKLVKCTHNIDAPYFVRYIISSRILSKKDFIRNKSLLEKSSNNKIYLHHGNTADQRRSYIENLFFCNKNEQKNHPVKIYDIIDIGCGEGFYAVPFSQKLENNTYIAFDIDKNELIKLSKKIQEKNIKNVIIHDNENDLFDFINNGNKFNVIITEVIEHMGEMESYDFIVRTFNTLQNKFNKIIITTPNYEFNQHYMMETQFRHPDHKMEMTHEQFVNFIDGCLKKFDMNNYELEYVNIGDSVDNISCTQGVIIKNKY
ncbi:MAG: methyltransferase domain-containing protein [Terrestrivirus sp.]|uniref:Small RNA 2'-O-methyltransferase n=1 Tax=Terrestrivirus sp. TaxID=2487775 RepID=A0A3G4ZQM6_9VIRU|nr:MAG: methyltransferase domain-containing protein [Terrestrivirus sp.]